MCSAKYTFKFMDQKDISTHWLYLVFSPHFRVERPLMSNPTQGASDLDRWIVYCWLFLRQRRKSQSSRRSPAIQHHRARELSVYCAGVEQLSCGALNCDKCDSFNVLFTCIILRILHYKVLNATVSFQFLIRFGLDKVRSLEGLFRSCMHKQRLSFRAAMTPPSTMAPTATSWTLRSTQRATALC